MSRGYRQLPTWEHQLVHEGRMFQVCEYDTDTDIATPKQVSIIVGAEELHAVFSISASAACKVQLMEGVVIGTGGSASAGTAVTAYNKNRVSTKTLTAVVKKDYVLGSSGQSAGTEIDAFYLVGAQQGALRSGSANRGTLEWVLKPSTTYGLIITAINDNTVLSWGIEGYEEG